MSTLKNTSLKKAAADLSQVLNSSLGSNADCMQAIANIEEVINTIENKLNGLPLKESSESLNFAPGNVGSGV